MPEEQVIGGFSKRLDRYYALSVGVMQEGGIVITEAYDYPDRGEQEGREYTYHLDIPAAYARIFLARLAREGHRDLPLDHTDKQQGLVALFKQ